MRKLAVLFALLCVASVKAQVSPIGALGSYQVIDNNGNPATSACLYFYQAGTSTQQATFFDSSGTVTNPNPLCVGAGARATGVWLTTGAFYKIVACLNNDGPFCSAGDILWQQDQVPGGAQSSGGSSSAPFISSSPNPATSGVLRCATGDQCLSFRNQAGSANLSLAKDSNDLFSIPTAWKLPAIAAPSGVAGFGVWWFDNSANRLKVSNNGATAANLVISRNDIDTTDAVKDVHFGATQIPTCSTAPTTNQFLQFSGTCIQGAPVSTEGIITFNDNITANCPSNGQTLSTLNACAVRWFWANAHTVTRFRVVLGTSAGCTTHPVYSVEDLTSSTIVTSLTQVNGTSTYDSGVLSLTTTAGHAFGIGMTTASVGCTTTPDFIQADMTYQ